MAIKKTAKAKDVEEPKREENGEAILQGAVAACPAINITKMEDVFRGFMGKSVAELVTTVGTADTILLSQVVIYIKRNYPNLHEEMLCNIEGYRDVLNFVNAGSAISKQQKGKDIW